MKKLYLLPFLVLLSSCTNNETTISKDKSNVKIIIEDSEYFKTEKSIYKIKKGENLSLYLDYKDGYTINSLNYSNSSIQRDDLGNAFVILNDIQYDTRIKVQSSEIGYVFVYHLNGGEYITPEKENKKDYFVSFEKNERHLYPNTSLGINRIQRQNFLLTGWNTKEDLTGDLISLGSRIDLKESKKIDLYANWIKETDCSKFTYTKEKDNTITIDSYIGKDGVDIVIPEKIGGYEVKTISSDFLWFYKCDNLIISRNIRNINEKAFYKCEFKNVVIYDTLKNVDDSSFLNSNIENIRINANSNPRFQSGNNNAEFVEKLDRLYSLKGKKKLFCLVDVLFHMD